MSLPVTREVKKHGEEMSGKHPLQAAGNVTVVLAIVITYMLRRPGDSPHGRQSPHLLSNNPDSPHSPTVRDIVPRNQSNACLPTTPVSLARLLRGKRKLQNSVPI